MVPLSFFQRLASGLTIAMLMLPVPLGAAQPVYKCVSKGSVAYQQSPCPSGEARRQPTVAELNAQRKLKLQQAADSGAVNTATPSQRDAVLPAPAPPARDVGCDGRKRCSQMTSCAEAKHFLAHCPGVEMDGDKNGIPCEKQWCH